jgi:hypothetical protein
MESAAPPENPIIASVLRNLKTRAERRQRRREEKEFKLKCERLTEKWRSAIAADPEMKEIRFGVWVGRDRQLEGRWPSYDDDDDVNKVLTKQDLIFDAVYEGLSPPYAYHFNPDVSKLREKCRQLARNVAKKVFPGEKALTNLFKLLGKESLSPAQYIQWLKEAWEYKYPPDKD